jgi:hypothetical protein
MQKLRKMARQRCSSSAVESAAEPAGGFPKVAGPTGSSEDRDPRKASRGRRLKDLPPAGGGAVALPTDLKLLNELMDEQVDNTRRLADASKNKTAVSYMAKGDFLVLFAVNHHNTPRERRYLCSIVDVVDGA